MLVRESSSGPLASQWKQSCLSEDNMPRIRTAPIAKACLPTGKSGHCKNDMSS